MTSSGRPRITVVGIGADGWNGLPEAVRTIVEGAPVLLGGCRHLGMVPPVAGQRRERWPSPLRAGVADLLDRHGDVPVVAATSSIDRAV